MEGPGPADAPERSAADPREAWSEGPDEASEESWLALDDDTLLHRTETLGSGEDLNERLLEVVASARHFFIRQEAAKRLRDRRLLFAYEEDRHVGQILVRHLNRREDLTYLERLAACSRHVEVRTAAQVQLARVWRRLEVPHHGLPAEEPPRPAAPAGPVGPITMAVAIAAADPGDEPLTTAAVERDGVDASLLGWAAHFVVEQVWNHLGTNATRELLRRTHQQLLPAHSTLQMFRVNDDAHVVGAIPPGARFPAQAVTDVAAWLTMFRRAARELAPDVRATSIRACTALMADALRDAGFYAACDAAEGSRT